MTKITLLFLFYLTSTLCLGQTLFFDNLNNSVWKSDKYYNEISIRNTKEIGLGKLINSTDSLQINVAIWKFKDDTLTIHYFNSNSKKDSLIATYKYEVNAEKGIIKIIFNDMTSMEYKIGITSSGNYVILSKKTRKKKQ